MGKRIHGLIRRNLTHQVNEKQDSAFRLSKSIPEVKLEVTDSGKESASPWQGP